MFLCHLFVFCVPGSLSRGRSRFSLVLFAGDVTPAAGYQSTLFKIRCLQVTSIGSFHLLCGKWDLFVISAVK